MTLPRFSIELSAELMVCSSDQLDPDNGKLVVTPGRKASGLVKGSGVTEGAEVQVNAYTPSALHLL